jgi:hypothetical protein
MLPNPRSAPMWLNGEIGTITVGWQAGNVYLKCIGSRTRKMMKVLVALDARFGGGSWPP